jgi:hypothetical protein
VRGCHLLLPENRVPNVCQGDTQVLAIDDRDFSAIICPIPHRPGRGRRNQFSGSAALIEAIAAYLSSRPGFRGPNSKQNGPKTL